MTQTPSPPPSDAKREEFPRLNAHWCGFLDQLTNFSKLSIDERTEIAYLAAEHSALPPPAVQGEARPTIVCLCGSTRFYKEFMEANYRETMAGKIVLSVGFYPHATKEMHGEGVGATDPQKAALDELHKRKIDLCDEVLVLDVGGYIGSSTRGEIEHATKLGRPIRYLSKESALGISIE